MVRPRHRALLFFLVALLIAALFAFGCGRIKETPNHLVGTWKTDSSQYRDRFLKFTPDTITFGTGEGTSLTYNIKYLKPEEQRDKSIVYELKFEDGYGDDLELSIVYRPQKGGSIIVGQIDGTWYRSE